MAFERVMDDGELWDGEMVKVVAGGRPLLLVRIEGALFAYEDKCLHKGMPLSGGRLDGGVITCSAHHWQFDAASGRGVNPRGLCLKSFAVRREGDGIYVDLEGDHEPAARQ